jgi:hypothetical protein
MRDRRELGLGHYSRRLVLRVYQKVLWKPQDLVILSASSWQSYLCDYSLPFSCKRIASSMFSYAKLRPTLALLSKVMHTSSAGAPTVPLRLLSVVGLACDIGLAGSWLGVLG